MLILAILHDAFSVPLAKKTLAHGILLIPETGTTAEAGSAHGISCSSLRQTQQLKREVLMVSPAHP